MQNKKTSVRLFIISKILIGLPIISNTVLVNAAVDPMTGTSTSFGTITSDFGPRVITQNNVTHGDFHHGFDYQSAEQTSIYGIATGEIGDQFGDGGAGTGFRVQF